MCSFQQDLLLTLNKSHEQYLSKINALFINEELMNNMSLEDAEKLIEYIKEFKQLINSMSILIDNINNIKEHNNIQKKIENELILKLLPISNIYRTLLTEKYSDKLNPINNINNQD